MEDEIKIPPLLLRGDADLNMVRQPKASLGRCQLQTNLLSGGNGHEIFSTPLISLVEKHVYPGWPKTHFLSFSESELCAFGYSMGAEPGTMREEHMIKLEDYYAEDDGWNFAIIEFDTSKISWKRVENGIYSGQFPTSMDYFEEFEERYTIISIDSLKALLTCAGIDKTNPIYINALGDKEWLLLPQALKVIHPGKPPEYCAIIDVMSVFKWKKFTFDS